MADIPKGDAQLVPSADMIVAITKSLQESPTAERNNLIATNTTEQQALQESLMVVQTSLTSAQASLNNLIVARDNLVATNTVPTA